jgi:hypothetical protein
MCTFHYGYISGGKELSVGVAETEDECANLVRTKKTNVWEQLGATYDPKTKHCDAEYAYGALNLRTYSDNRYRYCLFAGDI